MKKKELKEKLDIFKRRREKVCNKLKNSLLIVSSSITNYKDFVDYKGEFKNNNSKRPPIFFFEEDNLENFQVDPNFYYLTGLEIPKAILILTQDKYILFHRPSDKRDKIWERNFLTLDKLKDISQANEVYDISLFPIKLVEIMKNISKVYYNFGKDDVLDNIILKSFQNIIKGNFPRYNIGIFSLDMFIEDLRILKAKEEIELIYKAADITKQGFDKVFNILQPNIYEYEIASIFLYYYKKNNADYSFYPIIASGENSLVLHYIHNNSKIKDGDLVLIDTGAKYKNYCSDVTRTLPANGKYSKFQSEIYEAVLDTQKKVIKEAKSQKTFKELQDLAVSILVDHLLNLKILKGDKKEIIEKKEYQKFYPHNIGHFLGIDVHDIGNFYDKTDLRTLKPNMVITIEPGLYIPNEKDIPEKYRGIGIRIEDDILITEKGNKIITENIPKERKEIEKLLKNNK